MSRFGLRSLAALVFAVLAVVSVGAPAASARTAQSARPAVTSFVGTYTTHGKLDGTSMWIKSVIHINADGTATDKKGKVAYWTSQGKTITIDYSDGTLTEHLVGTQSKKGISSKKKPGTFTSSVANGVWYAVKTA